MIKGNIHSFQSLGTVDGPGVRFVVFTQGCNLRCRVCHNPDTWECGQGKEYTPEEVTAKCARYREYFGKNGGITFSGGEPLLQAEFVCEVFKLCHQNGINTCLDTSGSIMNDSVKQLLAQTDRVLLDIKYTTDDAYRENVGCRLEPVLDFLAYLNQNKIPTTLRTVIVPTVNDGEIHTRKILEIAEAHACVDKIELLPFRKICQVKYDNMGLTFPFGHLPEPTGDVMTKLREIVKAYL